MHSRDGFAVMLTAGLLACASLAGAGASDPAGPGVRHAADARARLLACDSARVMLQVLVEQESRPHPESGTYASMSSEVLALGSNGPEWLRRFADALLPEGRDWTPRSAPVPVLDRADQRLPWTVQVHAFRQGALSVTWTVDLLDGCAMLGHGSGFTIDVRAAADSLRAVLATGLVASPDAGRRLRQLREPDATILPLPEHLRR